MYTLYYEVKITIIIAFLHLTTISHSTLSTRPDIIHPIQRYRPSSNLSLERSYKATLIYVLISIHQKQD
jgi:hypothetical protein